MSPCAATSCCGEVMMEESHPAARQPQPAPKRPAMGKEPAPAKQPEPKTMAKPSDKPPVAAEKPLPPPIVPDSEPEEMPTMEEKPAETEPKSADDLSSTPATDPAPVPEKTPPAEEPAADESEKKEAEPVEEKDPLEDFFSDARQPAALSAPGGFDSNSHRQWTDNTGNYHCQARLVSVNRHEIVLSKSEGQLRTVSLRRLSDEDLKFVHGQVVAKREVLARQSANEKLASHWAE
jgi:hypothetical protein